jgi:hypothetical protein
MRQSINSLGQPEIQFLAQWSHFVYVVITVQVLYRSCTSCAYFTVRMLRNDTQNLLVCVDICVRVVLVVAAVLLRDLCLLRCDAVLLGE